MFSRRLTEREERFLSAANKKRITIIDEEARKDSGLAHLIAELEKKEQDISNEIRELNRTLEKNAKADLKTKKLIANGIIEGSEKIKKELDCGNDIQELYMLQESILRYQKILQEQGVKDKINYEKKTEINLSLEEKGLLINLYGQIDDNYENLRSIITKKLMNPYEYLKNNILEDGVIVITWLNPLNFPLEFKAYDWIQVSMRGDHNYNTVRTGNLSYCKFTVENESLMLNIGTQKFYCSYWEDYCSEFHKNKINRIHDKEYQLSKIKIKVFDRFNLPKKMVIPIKQKEELESVLKEIINHANKEYKEIGEFDTELENWINFANRKIRLQNLINLNKALEQKVLELF